NLSLVSGVSQIPNLSIQPGDSDYFRFTTTAAGTAANSVSIQFDASLGNLDLALYSATNTTTPLGTAQGSGGTATVPLQGQPAGTYYVRGYGDAPNGGPPATNPNFQPPFAAPVASASSKGDWTIMVYMTASNLGRYAERNIEQMEQAASVLPGSV